MTSMLDIAKNHSRRDRTFAGSSCIVCDEPLEHTLRGERILQLSCAHVSHEACFYEYIREFDSQHCPGCDAPLGLDSSRGGNVLNLEKLGTIVRSLHQNESQRRTEERNSQRTPTTRVSNESSTRPFTNRADSRYLDAPDHLDYRPSTATRGESNGTLGTRTSVDMRNMAARKSSYETAQPQDQAGSAPSFAVPRSPIPPPSVTIRSEYPTLTKSRQPQSLTCMITVEIHDGKWQPNHEDLQILHPIPIESSTRDSTSIPPSSVADADEVLHTTEELERVTEELYSRVDNWHGLDFSRFGKLRLYSKLQVGKDRHSWQDLECYLFEEMLICVKEKRIPDSARWDQPVRAKGRCSLKGSIMITKHLNRVESSPEESVLTLSLSVPELPLFHLHFQDSRQFAVWERALGMLNAAHHPSNLSDSDDDDLSDSDDDLYDEATKRPMSSKYSYGGNRRNPVSAVENGYGADGGTVHVSLHVPIDIVVVLPISSSMHGLKISLLRDTLRFLVQSLGPRDRVGLVTFGAADGAHPVVGMTTKAWSGWSKIVESIRAVGHRGPRGDLIEGANVAMDLLMQRKSTNPLSSILIISDSASTDAESIDFVVSRAEAAKVSIFCFGLGLTHKPDIMIELATRTKASYIYVKDWMMLRECIAGCLGALQSISHQNAKLKLRLPDGSPAKFVKISGAMQVTKRATGRDAEVTLGDLRFGDKRDILVQLAIPSESYAADSISPQDPWESIVSGLEALGGSLDNNNTTNNSADDPSRTISVEEVPMIQADLVYNDILREGAATQLPRPSLLAITMLSAGTTRRSARPATPPIPPHPSVVQRRMELLTSDMLTRALTLVSRGQHERAHHLLRETRSILQGLGKGGLPPLPPPPGRTTPAAARVPPVSGSAPSSGSNNIPRPSSSTPTPPNDPTGATTPPPDFSGTGGGTTNTNPSPIPPPTPSPLPHATPGVDLATMMALDAELESSLEWINHPAVFGRDSRKAVLQAIGVVSSQRGYTFRTGLEGLWAGRVGGVRRCIEGARAWREGEEAALAEEA